MNLWILHDTLDAVEVGEFVDRLIGILEETSDSLYTDRYHKGTFDGLITELSCLKFTL